MKLLDQPRREPGADQGNGHGQGGKLKKVARAQERQRVRRGFSGGSSTGAYPPCPRSAWVNVNA
jgi:hypothetical protein